VSAILRVLGAKIHKWGFALIFVAAGLVITALVCMSNHRLETTAYEVRSPRIPASFDRFRIVQISDLHNRRFGKHQSGLLQAIRGAHPDLIVITGDLVNERWARNRNSFELLRPLTALAPVYFVTGNHEIYAADVHDLLDFLEHFGVHVLRSSSVLLKRGGETIALAGIDDPDAFDYESKTDSLAKWNSALAGLRKGIEPGCYTILLSHRPELIREYSRMEFDLVLAGHAHGGQIRIPFLGALFVPDQGWLPRYVSGRHTLGQTTMIISRGLGSGPLSFRFLNPPELVVVMLRSQRIDHKSSPLR
jgi:predicted MPP superfamily phosphohydrolase